jgi:pSer/pThr/pTyr-binding forkhead associated (FHA) protein
VDSEGQNEGKMSLGELIPIGGGDPIPLLKEKLVVGRREGCDIVLKFPNVSSAHCELSLEDGHWMIRDLGSTNGTKVNGTHASERRLLPGDKIGVAKHVYEIQYEPGRSRQDPFARSLLESAGLEKRKT